jgi:hypothetical protein
MTHEHAIRKVGEAVDVPVYNCRVYVSPPDEQGVVTARAAALEGITGKGRREREALQAVVAAFKQRILELRQQDAPIPWLDPPLPPTADEQERLIAVHL